MFEIVKFRAKTRCRRMLALVGAAVLIVPSLAATEPVRAKNAMVVVQEPLAADVGRDVLKSGGNAVDAAVAIGFALAVTHPQAGNLGGGGFMLVRLANGKTTFLDFREEAPKAASHDMYLGPDGNATKDSIYGWRSSGVPGSVKGFAFAHKKFGSKKWADLLAPSLRLAKEGFVVDETLARSLNGGKQNSLRKDRESMRVFLRNGYGYQAGEKLQQSDLAATLSRIASKGESDFYEGETAARLASQIKEHGGLITVEDLKAYRVKERTPLTGKFRDYQIVTAPPPSAGGIGLLQMLGMIESAGPERGGPDSPDVVHYVAETMRRFYSDRSAYLADPDYFVVPVKQLLDPSYIKRRANTIEAQRATPSDMVEPGLQQTQSAGVRAWHESEETTHYNVVDAKGNAVAVTYTLNNTFGNGITVPGLGFLLNDEMDDFVAKPGSPNMFGMVGGEANAITPGKRPLSSMTPTIITKGGKLFMLVGAPGGSRITTGVMQVILDVLVHGMNAQDAVDLPRFHQQWKPDILYLQRGFDPQSQIALSRMGYKIEPISGVARVETIVINKGVLEGGTEKTQNGKVAGF